MDSASDQIKLHYSRLIDLLETEPELILLVSNRLILINPVEIAKKYHLEDNKSTALIYQQCVRGIKHGEYTCDKVGGHLYQL